jgi:hypothetical protein
MFWNMRTMAVLKHFCEIECDLIANEFEGGKELD